MFLAFQHHCCSLICFQNGHKSPSQHNNKKCRKLVVKFNLIFIDNNFYHTTTKALLRPSKYLFLKITIMHIVLDPVNLGFLKIECF